MPSAAPMNNLPERLRLLLSGANALNQSLNPKEVARVSLRLALQMLSLPMGLVLVFDRDHRPIVLAEQHLPKDWLTTFTTAALSPQSAIRHALATRQPLILPDPPAFTTADAASFSQLQVQSLVGFPFRVPGDFSGMVLLLHTEPHAYSEGDLAFLAAIVQQISAGLRNAWLFAKTQRQVEAVQSVAEAARVVVSSLDLNHILTHIMGEVTSRLKTEAAALLLLDAVREELEFAAVAGPASEGLVGVRMPMGQGIVGWVAEHNEPLLVPDVSQDPRFFKGLDKDTATTTQSVLCVPLRTRDQLIGVVEVINKKRGQFSLADQQLLESLASFAAVAIENARLFDEANRQIEQATLYARDLSAAYKRERQQREALDRLRYSFLNVVSHELKTPLTVILQGLEALKTPRRGELNLEQREIVAMLENQSGQLQRLIDGLVAFATFSARQGTMRFKQVPFDEVLDDVVALAYFKTTRKQITLTEQRPPNLPAILLDKERISEAIVHLIDNAVKFSQEQSEIVLNTTLQSNNVRVAVTDHGKGIPAEKLDSIWDSFSQMNDTMERGLEGLGLGLAIARYIVEAHNGKITVESVVGQGSTFTIELPLMVSPP